MARVFVYDNREFPDPDPKMSTEEVRQSMTNFFPELANGRLPRRLCLTSLVWNVEWF